MNDLGLNCPSEEDMLLLHYRDLDSRALEKVQEHLTSCPACRDRLSSLEKDLSTFPSATFSLPEREVRAFASRVCARVHRPRILWPAWGGALATATVLAFVLLGHRPDAPSSPGLSLKADAEILRDMEMLQDMEMLEDLDLLQELESQG